MSVVHACSIICIQFRKITMELGKRFHLQFLINSFQLEGPFHFSFTQEGDWIKKARGAKCHKFSFAMPRILQRSQAQWGSVIRVVVLSPEHNEWAHEQAQRNKLRLSSHNHHFSVFTKLSNVTTLSSSNNHLWSLHPAHVHIYWKQSKVFQMSKGVQISFSAQKSYPASNLALFRAFHSRGFYMQLKESVGVSCSV